MLAFDVSSNVNVAELVTAIAVSILALIAIFRRYGTIKTDFLRTLRG